MMAISQVSLAGASDCMRDFRVCVHIMHHHALWDNITLETRAEFSTVCKVSGGTWSAMPHFFLYSQAHNSADCIHGIIKATGGGGEGKEGGKKGGRGRSLWDVSPRRSADGIVGVHRKAGWTRRVPCIYRSTYSLNDARRI